MNDVKHRVFISYHHKDEKEVKDFIDTFDNQRKVFTYRALGVDIDEDLIDSTNPDYVMRRIRELYLKDSTVTIVMLGNCTWARRYVDWEIQASLRNTANTKPNGLLAVKLNSFNYGSKIPDRLEKNIITLENLKTEAYGECIEYPTRKDTLKNAIQRAYDARTSKSSLIENPREKFAYNRTCS